MSPPGKRLVGRLWLARSTPHAYRRHAGQEDDEREPASDSSLPVSRETGPSPRETAAIPPTPVRRRTLSLSDLPCFSNRQHSICPAQSGCICHVTPRQQYVVSHRARRTHGSRYRPLGCSIRLLLGCGRLRPTCLREGRSHRVSSSSLESRPLRSVASADSHGALPADTSPLVSRETDSQTQCGRHGSDDVIPRSALPGWVSTTLLLAVSGTHMTPVSNQEPHSCLSAAPGCRTPLLTPRLVHQQIRYRGREQHEESSLLECEPIPPPGKGVRRRHRPLIGYVRTHHVR